MADPRFYTRAGPFALAELAQIAGAQLGPAADAKFSVLDVASLDALEPQTIAFASGPREIAQAKDAGGFALILPPDAPRDGVTAHILFAKEPQRAFAKVLECFYPPDKQPILLRDGIDPTAKIGEGCKIAASAVIGANAEIGAGTLIESKAVIGPGVRIGRWSRVSSGVSISHALIGDRVIIHRNAAIGQDGFGYVMGPGGHLKLLQIGRVILQDDVEVGALCAIDRGALADTIIGQGSKLDNMVHIAHNCRIGRHCILAAMSGLSGSVIFEDFVVLGGQVGVAPHLRIGQGAMIAAKSGVTGPIPAGATYAGYPARPIQQWRREVASLARMVKNKGGPR